MKNSRRVIAGATAAILTALMCFGAWKLWHGANASFRGQGASHWKRQIEIWRERRMTSSLWQPPDCFAKDGKMDSDAMPVLLELLNDGNREIRVEAAYCLSHLGADARIAVGKLDQMLDRLMRDRQDDYEIREVMQTLGAIGPAAKESVPKLQEVLRSETTYSWAAAKALRQITQSDKPKHKNELP